MRGIGNWSLTPRVLVMLTLLAAFIINPSLRTATPTNTFATFAATPLSVPARVPVSTDLPLRTASQLRTEAESYNTALTEISRISTMRLSTVEELAQANAIVARNVSKLRYNRSKLAAIGLNDSTFTNAVRIQSSDTKSAERFALELAKDPKFIFTITGGQALADRLRRNLDTDVAKIRQIAAQLRLAASNIKANIKPHHSSRNNMMGTSRNSVGNSSISHPQAVLTEIDVAVIVTAVAVVAYPPLGLALLTISNAISPNIAVIFVAAAVDLIFRLVSNIGTEEGKDKIAACQEETDAKYRRCIDAAASLGLLKVPAEAVCYADWLLGSAACLVTY